MIDWLDAFIPVLEKASGWTFFYLFLKLFLEFFVKTFVIWTIFSIAKSIVKYIMKEKPLQIEKQEALEKKLVEMDDLLTKGTWLRYKTENIEQTERLLTSYHENCKKYYVFLKEIFEANRPPEKI